MLKVVPAELPEVLMLEYEKSQEIRGCSYPVYSKREMQQAGLHADFVEETIYCPKRAGTLYGIHFQNHPMAQTKLLYCSRGCGLDYAVDLRKGSANYKKWVCMELDAKSRRQIYIPQGFGHAFLSLEDDTNVVMWIDRHFDPCFRRGIAWNDPELNIPFPIAQPILAPHDINAPFLKDSDCNL